MRILPLNPYQDKSKYNTSFTSVTRIYKPSKITKHDIFSCNNVRTTSNIFRYDMDWNFLVDHILWNFMNVKKVNIYSLGCSDGSEAYTYALFLANKNLASLVNKFTPIIACDIDPEMIKIAQSGKINLDINDFINMKMHIKCPEKYFKKLDKPVKIKDDLMFDAQGYEVDSKIRNMVKFKKSDILSELKNIEDEGNTVVNIRNVFPYLNEKYINEILETLSKKLKSGSIFVFGHYDNKVPNFRQRLHDLGFFSPNMSCNFVQKK